MDTNIISTFYNWISNGWNQIGISADKLLETQLDFTNRVADGESLVSALATNLLPNTGGIISNFVTGVLTDIFVAVLSLFPNGGTLPTAFHTAAQYFGSALATVDFILPVSTLMELLYIVLLVKFALWFFHLLMAGVGFVRGVQLITYRW